MPPARTIATARRRWQRRGTHMKHCSHGQGGGWPPARSLPARGAPMAAASVPACHPAARGRLPAMIGRAVPLPAHGSHEAAAGRIKRRLLAASTVARAKERWPHDGWPREAHLAASLLPAVALLAAPAHRLRWSRLRMLACPLAGRSSCCLRCSWPRRRRGKLSRSCLPPCMASLQGHTCSAMGGLLRAIFAADRGIHTRPPHTSTHA
ncbi:hypothetical protein Dimus_036421 [Dionaea muscipula]